MYYTNALQCCMVVYNYIDLVLNRYNNEFSTTQHATINIRGEEGK